MPTYDYNCAECGYQYEVFHKISQEPLKECPKCSKPSLKRGIGGQNAVLSFKGSGFYITDYNQSKLNKSKGSES